MSKAQKQAKESTRGGVVHLGSASRPMITSAFPDNQATPDTVVATIVDTLPHCLERADKLPPEVREGGVQYWEMGSQVFASMSIEHSLRILWQRILWDGWKLDKKGAELRHGPSDRRLATYWEVWLWRHEMILTQAANLDALVDKTIKSAGNDVDPFISPTATGIGGSSRETRAFRFSTVSGRESGQSWHRAEITALEESYLAQFLGSALPRAHNLTCRNLQQAWCVIRDCAQILVTRARGRKFDSIDSIEAIALLIRRAEIERALTHCLAVTASDAAVIVDFLICDLSDLTRLFTKSFWAAPLLPISGGDDLAIVFPALSVGSAVRRVESWLERGGLSDHLSDARRGTKYEAWVRTEIANAISGNTFLTGCLCAPNAVPRSGGKGEQIDLIIVLGDMLIVGEVKCFLYPIESYEHYDYLRKLNEAGEQAVRKGKWLTQNPEEIVKAVGISAERAGSLRPVPIVVTNQGAGFGLDANGARVIDFHFLRLYFSDNEYVAGMAVKFSDRQAANQVEVLYDNEVEAADKFEKTMANPPPLQRYIRAAEWKENRFPLSSGESMIVENCVVGDNIADDANRLATIFDRI